MGSVFDLRIFSIFSPQDHVQLSRSISQYFKYFAVH